MRYRLPSHPFLSPLHFILLWFISFLVNLIHFAVSVSSSCVSWTNISSPADFSCLQNKSICLRTWPRNLILLFFMISISFLFSFISVKASAFVFLSIQLVFIICIIFIICLHVDISSAFMLWNFSPSPCLIFGQIFPLFWFLMKQFNNDQNTDKYIFSQQVIYLREKAACEENLFL